MVENSLVIMLPALVLGTLAGGAYFGLLWLTLHYLGQRRHPALWILLSLVTRMTFLLLALYWIAQEQWQRLLLALLGVMLMRLLFIRYLRPTVPVSGLVSSLSDRGE